MRTYGSNSIFPPVIKGLLITNIVIFFIQYLFIDNISFGGTPLGEYFIKYLALQPIDGINIFSIGTRANFYPWQLISYQFLHGGFMHLFFNMFALWMFGIELEHLWGSKKFLIYYLLAGIGAGLVQLFVSPLFTPVGPTIGASGSIYGVLLAFGLTFPNRPIFMFPFFIPIPAKIFVLIYAAIEMISGFSGNDGIAHFAHLGGALTGFLLLKYGDRLKIFGSRNVYNNYFGDSDSNRTFPGTGSSRRQEPKVYSIKWQYRSDEPVSASNTGSNVHTPTTKSKIIIDGEEITQEKIDAILDKISRYGYQHLSDREKMILTELSKKL